MPDVLNHNICINEKLRIKVFHSLFEKYVAQDENMYFEGESHNFWEMVYITEGEWGVSADDRVYNLTENQVIFHKPMEFHKIWKSSGCKSCCFICSFDIAGNAEFLEEKVLSVNHSQREIIYSILHKIRLFSKGEIYDALRADTFDGQYVANLLENFLISLSENQQSVKSLTGNADVMLFNKAVNILKENLGKTISVSAVASLCNVSVSKLSKLFIAYADCGVHEYHIKLKVNEAIRLLNKGYSSKEISDFLGFNNQNYFSMTFKRETGLSPLNYKKRY